MKAKGMNGLKRKVLWFILLFQIIHLCSRIFLSYPKSYEELLEDSEEIIVDDIKVKISSVNDLLSVKKQIKPLRDKDIIDIKELERIKSEKN